jgi:hypothetical protein
MCPECGNRLAEIEVDVQPVAIHRLEPFDDALRERVVQSGADMEPTTELRPAADFPARNLVAFLPQFCVDLSHDGVEVGVRAFPRVSLIHGLVSHLARPMAWWQLLFSEAAFLWLQ